uniref:FERM central domain-containing protein n=1 Tax=Lygus hesperus TaxID=30085 RepID=A0A0A9ZG90_LYGHE
MLGSYLVQSELGDFNSDEYTDTSYLKDFRFSPNQTPELESKVMELHKTHKGQTPSEAELHYLDPLHQQNNEANKEPINKRHTMPHPPSRVPGLDSSPAKKQSESGTSISSEEGEFSTHEKPLGGVAVLPTDGFGRKEKRESKIEEKTNGIGNESDDEKENREVHGDRESQKSPERTPTDKKSKSKSPGGGFSIFSKSPKRTGKSDEDGQGRDGQGRDGQGDTDMNRMNVFKTGKDKKDKKSKDKSGRDKSADKGAGQDGRGAKDGAGGAGDGGKGAKDGVGSDGAGARGTGDSKKGGDGKLESLGFTREYVYEETEDEKKRKALKSRGFSYERRGSKSEDELEESQRSPVRQNIGIAFNYSPTKRESSVDERSADDVGRGKEGLLIGKDGQAAARDAVARDGQQLARDGQQLARDGQQLSKDGQQIARDGQQLTKDGQKLIRDGQQLSRDAQAASKDAQFIAKEGYGKDGKTKDGRSGKEQRKSTASADSASTAESDALNKSAESDNLFKRGLGSLFKKKDKDSSSVSSKGDDKDKSKITKGDKDKDKDASSVSSKGDDKDKSKKTKGDKDKKAKSGKKRDSSSSSSSSDSSDDGEEGGKGGSERRSPNRRRTNRKKDWVSGIVRLPRLRASLEKIRRLKKGVCSGLS